MDYIFTTLVFVVYSKFLFRVRTGMFYYRISFTDRHAQLSQQWYVSLRYPGVILRLLRLEREGDTRVEEELRTFAKCSAACPVRKAANIELQNSFIWLVKEDEKKDRFLLGIGLKRGRPIRLICSHMVGVDSRLLRF